MQFDTHCHVNFPDFDADREKILADAQSSGLWMTNVGTDYLASKSAVDLAARFEKGVYATVGVHPTELGGFDEDKFAGLITNKVVAVGECGLDYHHKETTPEYQAKLFRDHIAFAQKQGLPLVIHCRDAYEDLIQILKSENYEGDAIIHSFTDTWETAEKFLDMGYFLAFNGILTYDKSGKLSEVAKNAPSDRILVETDAPFLTPHPNRNDRNTPANVTKVVERIAELRGESVEQVSEYTFKNALSIYNIKNPAT